MGLGKFEGLGVGLGSGPSDHNSSKPPEESTDVQSSKRGVYRCPSLSEVKGTEAAAQG